MRILAGSKQPATPAFLHAGYISAQQLPTTGSGLASLLFAALLAVGFKQQLAFVRQSRQRRIGFAGLVFTGMLLVVCVVYGVVAVFR